MFVVYFLIKNDKDFVVVVVVVARSCLYRKKNSKHNQKVSDRFNRTIPKWKVFLANLITVLFAFHDIRRIVFCLNKRKHLVSTVIVFFFLFIVNIAELITKRKQKTKIIDYIEMKLQRKNNLSRANDMFDNLFD